MKKTMTIFGVIMLASFMLTSCGGGSSKETVESTEAAEVSVADAPALDVESTEVSKRV